MATPKKTRRTTRAANEQRLRTVSDWLYEHNARRAWSVDVEHVGRIDCYTIRCRPVIVVILEDEAGFEVHMPPTDNGAIDATLAAADALLDGYLCDCPRCEADTARRLALRRK